MSEVKFSKEHEWITLEGEVATIGITKHATEMLGDIVFAELPEKGTNVEKDELLEWWSLQKPQVTFTHLSVEK